MIRRKGILLLTLLLLLPATGIGLYYAFLPYPWALRQEARLATRYNPEWPISEPEYQSATSYVRSQLDFYEFISSVGVKSPTEMTIDTTCRWAGPLSSSGKTFHLRKMKGKWVVEASGFWVS